MFKMPRQSASHLKNFQIRNLFYNYTSWFWSTLIPVRCKIKIIFKVSKCVHFIDQQMFLESIEQFQSTMWKKSQCYSATYEGEELQRTSECSEWTSEASSDSHIDVYLWGAISPQWTHISDCSVACVWLLVSHTLIYYIYDTVSELAILIIWEDDPYLN